MDPAHPNGMVVVKVVHGLAVYGAPIRVPANLAVHDQLLLPRRQPITRQPVTPLFKKKHRDLFFTCFKLPDLVTKSQARVLPWKWPVDNESTWTIISCDSGS